MMGKDIRLNSLEEKYGIPEPKSEAGLATAKKPKISTLSYHDATLTKINLPKLKCLRCGHEWISRKPKNPNNPKYCANCNSPYWNKLKVKQSGSKRESNAQAELCDDDACGSDDSVVV